MNLSVMQDGSERIRYRDPAIPIYVNYGDLAGLSNMSALCHWHEDVELLMPLEGYLSYNVSGNRVQISAGQAIFVNARQMHYGFSADGTDCRYVCITFRPQLLCASDALASRYVLPVITSPNLTHLVFREPALLDEVRRLVALFEGQDPDYLEAMGCLFRLWQGIFRLLRGRVNESDPADMDLLVQKRMLEFIRTHYRERVTVDAIAASGGVCRSKCCQLFRRYLETTPNNYLNAYRLEKGMELLKGTCLSVTEIAEACGFSSASYFTEMFTRQKGCPPKDYRKRK